MSPEIQYIDYFIKNIALCCIFYLTQGSKYVKKLYISLSVLESNEEVNNEGKKRQRNWVYNKQQGLYTDFVRSWEVAFNNYYDHTRGTSFYSKVAYRKF